MQVVSSADVDRTDERGKITSARFYVYVFGDSKAARASPFFFFFNIHLSAKPHESKINEKENVLKNSEETDFFSLETNLETERNLYGARVLSGFSLKRGGEHLKKYIFKKDQ